jgi:Uma2 family endonuclease
MSAITTPPKLLTIEEYARLPDDGRMTELVRGRVVVVTRPSSFHGFVCSKIDRVVGNFVDANDLGRVLSNDAGIITERDPDTLRGADVCFYSYARVPRGPLPEEGYIETTPDLVFEVVSPSDRWPQVLTKVGEYLTAGVAVVCVVNPRNRSAIVYRPDGDPETVAADAELTLPDVLPGFRVPLRQFFE